MGIMNKSMNFISDNEAELILKRYDKNKDGKVSFAEFLREITPSIGIDG